MALEEICGHTVYTRPLRRGAIVVDLGANIGRFSGGMIQRFGARCYAVEPNPAACQRISPDSMLTVFPCAIAGRGGVQPFYAAANSESSALSASAGQHLRQTVDVIVKTLSDFLLEQGIDAIDVLKLDIEGAEIGVIASCPDEVLRRIVQITIEFHDFNGVTPVEDVIRTMTRLRKLGFFALRMSRRSHIDVLLINQNCCRLGPLRRAWMTLVSRNWRGVCRMAGRRMQALRPRLGVRDE